MLVLLPQYAMRRLKLYGWIASCLVTLHLTVPTAAIPIDNGVTDQSIECMPDAIRVTFQTQNPFQGRIYVKGMVDVPDCVETYTDGTSTSPEIMFTFGLLPQRGMMQSIVVIISFHPTFLTKVDRAFRLECFYMEADKTVSADLEVSMLTTGNIQDQAPMPVCTYTVRQGSREGAEVRYTSIGAEIYHEWQCDSDSHGMLIKDCHVEDGQGARHEIIDVHGCAIDPVIMPDLTYETTGIAKAYVEAHAFKFADRPNVHFQCVVQLCNRIEPECQALTPPQCSGARPAQRTNFEDYNFVPPANFGLPPNDTRSYRSSSQGTRLRTLNSRESGGRSRESFNSRENLHRHPARHDQNSRGQFQVLRHRRSRRDAAVVADEGPEEPIDDLGPSDEVDLTSNSFVVFDIPDALPPEVEQLRRTEDSLFVSADEAVPRAVIIDNQLCLSPSLFGVLLSVVLLVFMLSTTVSVCFCMGRIRVDRVKIR